MARLTTAKVALRYLECGGSECPHCGRAGFLRLFGRVRGPWDLGGLPLLYVPCHCAGCGGEWHERYQLEGVSIR